MRNGTGAKHMKIEVGENSAEMEIICPKGVKCGVCHKVADVDHRHSVRIKPHDMPLIDTNADQPKKYRLSEMWVVWYKEKPAPYKDNIVVVGIKKSPFFERIVQAQRFAEQRSVSPLAITRADATEFTEGEGL